MGRYPKYLPIQLKPDSGYTGYYSWWAAGTVESWNCLMIFGQETIGGTHCLALTIPPPSPFSNGGVGFLSRLAATSKRKAGSYKRALISVEPPNPQPSPLYPPAPSWGMGRGTEYIQEGESQRRGSRCPTSVCVNLWSSSSSSSSVSFRAALSHFRKILIKGQQGPFKCWYCRLFRARSWRVAICLLVDKKSLIQQEVIKILTPLCRYYLFKRTV